MVNKQIVESKPNSGPSGDSATTEITRIDEMFPALAARQGPAPVAELPMRACNALRIAGIDSWEQILDLDIDAIKGIRNVGETTVSDILQWCRRHAAEPKPNSGLSRGSVISEITRIDEMFPALAARQGPAPVAELPMRACNALRIAGIDSWEQILGLDINAIMGIRNVGDKTVDDILQWCRRHAAEPESNSGQSTGFVISEVSRIDEMFPALAARQGPAPVAELPMRACNALRIAGIDSWEQILGLDINAIKGIRNVGDKTVDDILQWCRRHAAEPIPVLQLPASVCSATALLIRWLRYKGRESPTLGDMVELLGWHPTAAPPDVVNAADELLSCSLQSWGAVKESKEVEADDAFSVQDILGDERKRHIWSERNLYRTDRPPSFAVLGKRFGITAEAARRQNQRASSVVRNAIENDHRLETFRWRAYDLATQLGSGVPLNSSLALSVLADESDEQRIVLWYAGPYNKQDDWLVRAGENPKVAVTRAIRDHDRPLLTRDQLIEIMAQAEIPASTLTSVISSIGLLRDIGDGLFVKWYGTIPDKAAVVFALLARPATPEEIVSHFTEDRNARSIRNALANDDRFYRTSKFEWALREWELEEYSGITNEIIERIDRDGGRTDVAMLIEELVSLFDVAESSVRTYLKAPAFVIEESFVRKRRDDEAFEFKPRPLKDSGQCFRPSPSRLITHFVVNEELLRGSGRVIDPGMASQLDLRPGQRLKFASIHQDIAFYWHATSYGAELGSLRPAVKALGGQPEDLLVMELNTKHRYATCHLVDVSQQGLQRLKALTGIGDEPDVQGALAAAIGVSKPELLAALRSRGDDDLIPLLPGDTAVVEQ